MPVLPLRSGLRLAISNAPRRKGEHFVADSPHRPSSRPRSPGGDKVQVFKSGDLVRETGIYEVLHDGAHRPAHEVVMLATDAFPACETCSAAVRFRLLRSAPYIFLDEDFGHPRR
jgi:hypothetical protein